MTNRVSILGVLIGGVVDVVGSMISNGVVVFGWYATKFGLGSAQSPEQLSEQMSGIVKSDSMLFATTFLVGSLFSILGGYIAARFAKSDHVLNGALSAWLCVGMGLYGLFVGHAQHTVSTALAIVSIPLSFALAAFGGYQRQKQTNS